MNQQPNNKIELSVVLHDGYGGFSILPEIAEYLHKRKGWEIIPIQGMALKRSTDPKIIYRTYYNEKPTDNYWCEDQDSITFRSNPDLIEAVQHVRNGLEQAYNQKKLVWKDYYYSPLRSFKVVIVSMQLEIETYNDGHERIVTSTIQKKELT